MDVHECRLIFHKKVKPEDDILFTAKDFLFITKGSLLEIYQQENDKHHLIKIDNVNSNPQQKDTISFDSVLGNSLKLTPNKSLKFQVINENLITLDVLDIIIRDQYLSRSDMYRFIHHIQNSVLQMSKKLDFGGCFSRGTVSEMWCNGQRNHCGYFGANTRVVFRSATSVVHIFIQMSTEMWEFDYFGELYFDKAINFISDLFLKWQDYNCGHDMTIVLFSRLFYKNLNQENLSDSVKRNIKIDQNGRFYEDFYIVVVQNERYVGNEWRKVIKTLKFRFNNYKTELEQFQQNNFDCNSNCESYLSSAEDANFLETLNITLNLYENYYIDRNFERTGKVCVVITAGSGVYNVDRAQTHITKQRICDLGVGMDLVCIGEQPLHAVPLFIFPQKGSPNITDNYYYIPYWINHSFYRSVNELQAIQMGKFIPRIKVSFEKSSSIEKLAKPKDDNNLIYELSENSMNFVRKLSKPEIVSDNLSGVISTSNNCERGGLYHGSYGSYNSKDDTFINPIKPGHKRTIQSDHRKALFNPFAPNRFNVRTTSNSRRWSHVFPIDKNNKPIQLHHQLAINNPDLYGFKKKKSKNMAEAWKNYYKLYTEANNKSDQSDESTSSLSTRETILSPKSPFRETDDSSVIMEKAEFHIINDKISDESSAVSPLPSSFQGGGSQKSFHQGSSIKGSINRRVHTLFTEGEQKWSWDQPKEDESPTNHLDVEESIKLIGVDWKSLTLPAMLPITSDYYPSARVLEDEFLESNYQLMANSLNSSSDMNNQSHRKPLGIHDVFQELIYQRLNQGFQLITNPPTLNHSTSSFSKDINKKGSFKIKDKNAIYKFGLGRIFHSIQMKQDLIHVTQYSPRHTNNLPDITYNYCLKMPDSKDFMMSKTKFSTQMLEKFNWNYHDHYILNYGGNINESTDDICRYKLIPSLKFWRSRFYLLPTHSATKVIMDMDKNKKIRCDIYDDKSVVEQNSLIEEFFKFLEGINKIKRRSPNSKPKMSMPVIDNSSNLMNNPSMVKVKSVSGNLLEMKSYLIACESSINSTLDNIVNMVPTSGGSLNQHQVNPKSAIQSACIVTNANPMSPSRPPVHHRHSTTHEPNHYNQLCELISNNSSNPVTPIEKYPRQVRRMSSMTEKFTFDSLDNAMKSSSGLELDKLSDSSLYTRVLEEMMSPQNGLIFLQSPEFPNEYTFTSYEAVNWCINKIDKINDVKSAVTYLQKLMNLKYIFHASEYSSHKFVYGFVFYCLCNPTKFLGNGWLDVRNISNANSSSSSLTNLATDESDNFFKSKKNNIEWVEVYLSSIEIDGKSERDWYSEYIEKPFTGFHLSGDYKPVDSSHNFIFLMKNIPEKYLINCLTHKNVQEYIGNSHDPGMLFEKNGIFYKKVVLDIESEQGERAEWGVFQYQANYHPTMAFEFMLQWLVATGGKLAEKISLWSKKKPILQLVPVPCDPFALPSSINSDPLRGPIFVPLNIECLIENADYFKSSHRSINDTIDFLFDEFSDEERLYRLMLLQEAILKRFGFIRESCINYSSKDHFLNAQIQNTRKNVNGKQVTADGCTSFTWSYIHYSGGMFAMIPSYSQYKDINELITLPVKIEETQSSLSSSNTRHVNTDEDSESWETVNIGFLWSWNKMLTRKWTTGPMVIDEQFQDRMLADFREFSNNTDNRLKQFYLDVKMTAAKYFCDKASHV